jgi:hypothetical protein
LNRLQVILPGGNEQTATLFQADSSEAKFSIRHDCRRKGAMEQHSTDCKQQFDAGWILLYGPVMARDGAFGLASLEVTDETEARLFGTHSICGSKGTSKKTDREVTAESGAFLKLET